MPPIVLDHFGYSRFPVEGLSGPILKVTPTQEMTL
jgi:hypothetical protein